MLEPGKGQRTRDSIHCQSQLPSTDGTKDQGRPRIPSPQHSYSTAQQSRRGVPRGDPKEFISCHSVCKAQQSPNLAFGSPGLAPANLLSGCLSKPIKANH